MADATRTLGAGKPRAYATQLGRVYAKAEYGVSDNATHVFRLELAPGQAIYLADEGVTNVRLPLGAVLINAPLAENGLPTFSMRPGLTDGRATISNASYRFLDHRGELDAWLNNKLLNGYQVFGGLFEHYVLDPDDILMQRELGELGALQHTWIVRGTASIDLKVVEFTCEDIQRDLDSEVFTPRAHRLARTLDADEKDEALIYLTEDALGGQGENAKAATWLFEHGPDYLVLPGETAAIGLLEGDDDEHEFIAWSGIRNAGGTILLESGERVYSFHLTGLTRGLFNTTPLRWAVDEDDNGNTDQDAEVSSRPEIKAIPYAEEHRLSMALAVMTGKTADGREFPWGLKLDERWVARDTFEQALDTRRHTYVAMEKTKGLDFVESMCLARRGFMVPDATGALAYVDAPVGAASPAPAMVLDENTVYMGNVSKLVHDEKECATGIVIKWDRDPYSGKFRRTTTYTEPAALRENSATEPVTIEAPFYSTGLFTETAVREDARVLFARHARPVRRLSAQVAWTLAHHRPGTVVQVRLPIKDYTRNIGFASIDTPMMIASIDIDWNREEVRWDLIGFRSLPNGLAGPATNPLPDSAYTEGAVQIRSSNGRASLDQTIRLDQPYYHLGDLVLPPGWPQAIEGRGTLILKVKGTLLNNAVIDLQGRGGRGGAPNQNGHAGGAGERRYLPALAPTGTLSVVISRRASGAINRRNIVSAPPAARSNSSSPRAAVINVERQRVVGVPATLAGSGGPAGDRSYFLGTAIGTGASANPGDTGSKFGSGGGDGGGGVYLLCDPGSGSSISGRFILSGDDGRVPNTYARVVTAAGAGGAHGFMLVVHPFQGSAWPMSGNTLVAEYGRAVRSGIRSPSKSESFRDASTFVRSYYDPADDLGNRWRDAYQVAFLPPTEAPAPWYSSLFAEFFLTTQPDGQLRVYVQSFPPSDGNPFDLVIDSDELQSGGSRPNFQFLDPERGWITFNWENDPYLKYGHVFLAAIAAARRGGNAIWYSPLRPTTYTEGDLWINSDTGEGWILYESGDVLAQVGDHRVGENKWYDGNLAMYPDKQTIYVFDNLDLTPSFPIPGSGGNDDPGDTGSYALNAPVTVRAEVNDRANGLNVYIGFPPDSSGISGYEVRIDGEVRATVSGGYAAIGGLTSGETVRITVRSVNGAARSADVGGNITLNAGNERTYQGGQQGGGGVGGGGGGDDGGRDGLQPGDYPLNPPENLTVDVVSSTRIAVFIGFPVDPSGVTNYEIRVDGSLVRTVGSGEGYADIQGISAGVRIVEVRSVGNGQRSADFRRTVDTNGGGGGGGGSTGGGGTGLVPPSNVRAEVYSSTSLELFWEPSSEGNAYAIRVNGNKVAEVPGRTSRSHYLDGLTPATDYVLGVRTIDGQGGTSNDVNVNARTRD